MRMSSSSWKSTSRCEICSGLQAVAQRRSARCGLFSPFHLVFGPATTVPSGRCSCPLSLVCTYSFNRGFVNSLAGLGRQAAVYAFHWATVARYSGLPPRVAALRRSSRETVRGTGITLRLLDPLPDRGLGQIEVPADLPDRAVATKALLDDLSLELRRERPPSPGVVCSPCSPSGAQPQMPDTRQSGSGS